MRLRHTSFLPQFLLTALLLTASCGGEDGVCPSVAPGAIAPALVAQLDDDASRAVASDQVCIFVQGQGDTQWSRHDYRLTAPGSASCGLVAVDADQAITLPSDGSTARLVACLPASALSMGDDGPVLRIDDWSQQDQILGHQDLCIARLDGLTAGQPQAQLSFRHVLSRVSFDVTLGQNYGLSLDGLTVHIAGVNRPMTYDVLRSVARLDDVPVGQEVRCHEGAVPQQAWALLPPATSGADRQVTFRLGAGQTFTWAMPDDVQLRSGCNHAWQVVLRDPDATLIPDDGVLTIIIPADADASRCNLYEQHTPAEVIAARRLRIIGPLNAYDIESLQSWLTQQYNEYLDLSRAKIVASQSPSHQTFEDEISEWFFRHDVVASTLLLPESVTRIEKNTFWPNIKLKEVKLPSGLTALETSVFNECSNLRKIHFGDQIQRIENFALKGCNLVGPITLPLQLREIGELAFANNNYLNSIELPPYLEYIGIRAFFSSDVYTIISHAAVPPVIANRNAFENYYRITLYVPESSIELYKEDPMWRNFSKIKPIPTDPQ